MVHFVINGRPDCAHFNHAIHVARYLNSKLPDFQYKKIEKMPSEWTKYIYQLNQSNKWYITKSPLIWKEIYAWGGKKYLIGGLSEFWEYIYCYYGLESVIPKGDMAKLASDNLKFFLEQETDSTKKWNFVQNITIFGACSPQTPILLNDLLELDDIKKQKGVIIRLYDTLGTIEKKKSYLQECAGYVNSRKLFGDRDTVIIFYDEGEAIKGADILIHVEDYRMHESEPTNAWLERCLSKINQFGDTINIFGNRNLRIILNNHGPVCFLATCLLQVCTRMIPYNIVAVTADEGLSALSVISERSGIPIDKISAPPVWGFAGLKSFVDERHTVFKADMYMPYKRALTGPIGSTLPLGTVTSELRLISYLLPDDGDDYIAKEVERRKIKMNIRLDRGPVLAKVRAVVSLVKLWLAGEQPDPAIISLGVSSNGSFGFPPGMVFSQPVKLEERGKWTPYSKFPLMNEVTMSRIRECIQTVSEIMRLFKEHMDPPVSESSGSMYTQYSPDNTTE
ncbi:hypothetical protein JTB14_023328 [Gonioctena quinquepunctata]|nr:hypothetical protein JTB14_023328 [Gonioctena quinquepunctata]